MWHALNTQHLVRSGSNHACDEPKVTTNHHVLSIERHFVQLITPPAVQCLKKFDNHVEHILSGVALEHGDNNQVEVREITTVAGAKA